MNEAQLSSWRSHTMASAKVVSTFAFLFNFMFMIVLVQIMGGGLPKGCNVFGFVDFQNASNYLAFFKYSVILLQHIVLFSAPFLKPLQSD